jgi:hypothetical protein
VPSNKQGAIILTKANSMGDLYARLSTIGFDREFVRSVILPEWWEDSLAHVPANRALAEDVIARHLGISLADLSHPSAALALPSFSHVKFKRYKNRANKTVAPALVVAQRAARILVDAVPTLPEFNLCQRNPVTVRQAILRHSRYVTLASLTEFCWDHGIVVFHLAKTPKKSNLFDGLAMFCGDRPVLVLGSRRDSPAWLAFHLAHELGHVLKQHVTPGSPPLADSDLTSASTDHQEKEADRAACEILTGMPAPRLPDLKLTAPRLALTVAQEAPERGVDPGVLALIYGRSNDRWGVAQSALKYLSLDSGGRDTLNLSLTKRLNPEDLSESSERFLTVLSPNF